MPTLFARRYLRHHVPLGEKVVGVVILLILAAIGATFAAVSLRDEPALFELAPGTGPALDAGPADVSAFPPLDLPGWRRPDNTRVFTAANLWEKIDGRADLYLAYNFATLTFGTYRGDNDLSLDVYWYDMTEVDNAFGIYRAEYGGRADPLAVGREAYRAGSSVFFWKGAHYVRLEAAEESAELSAAAEALAASIAAVIPDDGRPLWADALLPRKGRLPGSFEYHGQSAFGLDFLTAVFSADYETDGQGYKLFIHRAPDADSAAGTFAAYVRFFDEYGRVLQRGGAEGPDLLIGESGGVIDAVFVLGQYLGGVSGAEDAALAEGQAKAFRALLEAAPASGRMSE